MVTVPAPGAPTAITPSRIATAAPKREPLPASSTGGRKESLVSGFLYTNARPAPGAPTTTYS
jgi:hypothetical protein